MLGILGGLAHKFLPGIIGWGVKKLSTGALGKGIGDKFRKFKKVINSPIAKSIYQAVSGAN